MKCQVKYLTKRKFVNVHMCNFTCISQNKNWVEMVERIRLFMITKGIYLIKLQCGLRWEMKIQIFKVVLWIMNLVRQKIRAFASENTFLVIYWKTIVWNHFVWHSECFLENWVIWEIEFAGPGWVWIDCVLNLMNWITNECYLCRVLNFFRTLGFICDIFHYIDTSIVIYLQCRFYILGFFLFKNSKTNKRNIEKCIKNCLTNAS